jgi:hypothetical protein
MINHKIRKFLPNTAQLCLKALETVLKVVFVHNFFYYVQILIGAVYAIFVRRKGMFLRTCGSFKSASHLSLQICGVAIFRIYFRIAQLCYYQDIAKN